MTDDPTQPEYAPPAGKTISVADRRIGPAEPTFVIAEIGVNHDGDLQKALELVRIAVACGADAVKLQIFRATALMHPSGVMAAYQRHGGVGDDPIDMLRRYELKRDELRQIVKAIVDARLVPLATPFSLPDVETVASLRLPAVKVASPDLVNLPLLREIARLNKPMLLSTGAATMAEVRRTVGWSAGWKVPVALLHCVSSYPVPPALAHLAWIAELDRAFEVPIGYSDHTTATTAGAMAVAAGATIVEKHLTYDRNARGPDHAASADPQQFERYVKTIREADLLRGTPGKRLLDCERDVRSVSRQSLVLRRTMTAGETIGEADLAIQRPGTGVPAASWDAAVGRRMAQDVKAGGMLTAEMLEPVAAS